MVKTCFITGLNVLVNSSANGFASKADAPATAAIEADVTATCAEGRYCSTAPISSYNITHIFLF